MTADATTCQRGLGECIILAGASGFVLLVVFLGAAVVLFTFLMRFLKAHDSRPIRPRVQVVRIEEDPTTQYLNIAEAQQRRSINGIADPCADDEIETTRQRLTGGQRYLGRGGR